MPLHDFYLAGKMLHCILAKFLSCNCNPLDGAKGMNWNSRKTSYPWIVIKKWCKVVWKVTKGSLRRHHFMVVGTSHVTSLAGEQFDDELSKLKSVREWIVVAWSFHFSFMLSCNHFHLSLASKRTRRRQPINWNKQLKSPPKVWSCTMIVQHLMTFNWLY